MTREEATMQALQGHIEALNLTIEKQDKDIKALEQEPCEDAVSRQAILKEIPVLWNSNGDKDYCMETLRDFVAELPPVTPSRECGKQKKGKWICVHHLENKITYDSWKCSECQHDFDSEEESTVDFDKYKYCPNCGAKMERE